MESIPIESARGLRDGGIHAVAALNAALADAITDIPRLLALPAWVAMMLALEFAIPADASPSLPMLANPPPPLPLTLIFLRWTTARTTRKSSLRSFPTRRGCVDGGTTRRPAMPGCTTAAVNGRSPCRECSRRTASGLTSSGANNCLSVRLTATAVPASRHVWIGLRSSSTASPMPKRCHPRFAAGILG